MEAKAQGKTFDDVAADHEERGIPFKFAERKSRKERRRQQGKDVEEAVAGVAPAEELARTVPAVGSSADYTTGMGTGGEDCGDEMGD